MITEMICRINFFGVLIYFAKLTKHKKPIFSNFKIETNIILYKNAIKKRYFF